MSSLAFLQSADEIARRANESQEGFFGFTIWLLVGVPIVLAIVIAARNRYPKQTVREFDGDSFDADVLEAPLPTLVHFYRPWNIGDQCLIAQVEKLAVKARDFSVGFVDVEKFPALLERFTNVGAPALLLFAKGRRIFQCEGVVDEADVLAGVRDALARLAREEAQGVGR